MHDDAWQWTLYVCVWVATARGHWIWHNAYICERRSTCISSSNKRTNREFLSCHVLCLVYIVLLSLVVHRLPSHQHQHPYFRIYFILGNVIRSLQSPIFSLFLPFFPYFVPAFDSQARILAALSHASHEQVLGRVHVYSWLYLYIHPTFIEMMKNV